jgi:hypothetical protein
VTHAIRTRLVSVLIFLIVCAGSQAAVTENEQDGAPQLISVFTRSVGARAGGAQNLVFRWPANRILCTYGDPSPADLTKLASFTYALNRLTGLNIRNFFRKSAQACPEDTLIYLSFRKQSRQFSDLVQDELNFVGHRSRSNSPRAVSRENSLAFAASDPNAGYVYITLPSLGETMNMFAGAARNELMEKTLFQMLTQLLDTSPLQGFPSAFRDPLDTFPQPEPDVLVRGIMHRQQNLCLLDLMLLYSLYKPKPKQNLVPMPLGYHLDFITNSFDGIKKASEDIYYDPDFQDIFPKKC